MPACRRLRCTCCRNGWTNAKILPYWWLGLFTAPNLSISLILMPLAPIGMMIGIKFNHLIPQKWFMRASYTILFVLGTRLLYEGLVPLF